MTAAARAADACSSRSASTRAERLEQRADADAVRAPALRPLPRAGRAHAARELWLRGAPRPRFDEVHRERDNFRAALAWADGTPAYTRLAGHSTRTCAPPMPSPRRSRSTCARSRSPEARPRGRRPRPARAVRGAPAHRPPRPRAGERGARVLRGARETGDGSRSRCSGPATSRSWTATSPRATRWPSRRSSTPAPTGDRALEGYALTQMAIGSVDIERGRPLLEAGLDALAPRRRDQPHPGRALHGRVRPAPPRRLRRGRGAAPPGRLRRQPDPQPLPDRAGRGQPRADLTDARRPRRGPRGLRRPSCGSPTPARSYTFYFEAFLGLAAARRPRRRRRARGHARGRGLDAHATGPSTAAEEPVYTRVTEQFLAPARERLGPEATAIAPPSAAARWRSTTLVVTRSGRARVAPSSRAGRGSRRRAG